MQSSGKTMDVLSINAPSKRHLAGMHVLALGIVAALLLVGAVSVHMYSMRSLGFSEVIDRAGRQRMLSQRIAFEAQQLVTGADETARRNARAYLEKSITAMAESHQFLTGQGNRAKVASYNTSAVQALYFGPTNNVDRLVRGYLTRAQALLEASPQMLGPSNADYMALRSMAQNDIIDALDAVVRQYADEDNARMETVPMFGYGLFGVILLTLLLEYAFIFRPLINSIVHSYDHLKKVSTSKSEFLAAMSHEIRTPINAIMGIGELLQESDLTVKQQGQIRTLLTSTDSLLLIIDDILDLSKVESGRLQLEEIPFDLNSAAEDAVEMLAVKARAKRLEVVIRYMPGTPHFVVGDPGRVRQVIANLVNNAVKFTPSGYVLITIEQAAQEKCAPGMVRLRVRVEDTGIGIAKEKQARIFEQFMQADNNTNKKYGGTGLGLAICRQLVGLMNGEIGVESEEGKGSVFWFTMELGKSERKSRLESSHTILHGKHVIIVDDLSMNLDLLGDAMRQAGAIVRSFQNPLEGLQEMRMAAAAGKPYELALLDYLMPEMDGETLARTIRNDNLLADMPVMVLSSVADKDFVRIFQEIGVAAYLNKPVRKNMLLDTASVILDSRARGVPFDLMTGQAVQVLRAQDDAADGPRLDGVRVLLAEDNAVNREFTTEMLKNMGCSVDLAEDGQMAFEKVRGHRYDIILMDCLMPIMDGFEATRNILALYKERGDIIETPIIALTANAMEKDREKCLASGMHDYLSKPVRRANLEAMLLRWIKKRKEGVAARATAPGQSMMTEETMASMAAQSMPSQAASQPASSRASSLRPASPPPASVRTARERSPAVPQAIPVGIDSKAFREARLLVGGKFDALINFYLDDAQRHLQKIQSVMDSKMPIADITMSAHTLKSSSRQFGFTGLSDCAQKIESLSLAARAANSNDASRQIGDLLREASQAYLDIRKYVASERAS